MSSRDILGLVNGLRKVITAYGTELNIEFQNIFSVEGSLGGREAIETRFYYSEINLKGDYHHVPPHPHDIDHMSDVHKAHIANQEPQHYMNASKSRCVRPRPLKPPRLTDRKEYHTRISPASRVWNTRISPASRVWNTRIFPTSRAWNTCNCSHKTLYSCAADEVTGGMDSPPGKDHMTDGSAATRKSVPEHRNLSRERSVPTSRISRLANFGGLAAGLGVGTAKELAKRALGISDEKNSMIGSPVLTEENIERVVSTLCKVRGAALKLGQMISLQDSAVIPSEIQEVFERVRNSADIMPSWQVETVLKKELGSNWREELIKFDSRPLAAASIGQVHRAVTKDNQEVAMKIQYPGVAKSIDSDIDNLVALLKIWRIVPEGLFLEESIDVIRKELVLESDYLREAQCSTRFRSLLAGDAGFVVPKVIQELTTEKVLTAELVNGVPLDECTHLSQDIRNDISRRIMNLCLRELLEFRFMQTDPNWSNFYYNHQDNKIYLLDFGASREYSKEFVDDYVKVIQATVARDRKEIFEASKNIGLITGYESKSLIQAHIDATLILGELFANNRDFDFGTQETTANMHKLMPLLLRDRLAPIPEEIYSIHRKLAGSFLLNTKLKAKINCYHIFQQVNKYQ